MFFIWRDAWYGNFICKKNALKSVSCYPQINVSARWKYLITEDWQKVETYETRMKQAWLILINWIITVNMMESRITHN